MGQRFIIGHEEIEDGTPCIVLYCSTTGWAFGPVITGDDEGPHPGSAEDRAKAFLAWCDETIGTTDLRGEEMAEVDRLWHQWLGTT